MPLLQHITAKYVSERHQMDLVDMKGEEVSANGREYRYIRTLQDVFSRFLWMRALEQRRSKSDAKELNRIYWEHSPPKILQCGNTMFNFLPITVHFQLVVNYVATVQYSSTFDLLIAIANFYNFFIKACDGRWLILPA